MGSLSRVSVHHRQQCRGIPASVLRKLESRPDPDRSRAFKGDLWAARSIELLASDRLKILFVAAGNRSCSVRKRTRVNVPTTRLRRTRDRWCPFYTLYLAAQRDPGILPEKAPSGFSKSQPTWN